VYYRWKYVPMFLNTGPTLLQVRGRYNRDG
jgi:hypothetical protein